MIELEWYMDPDRKHLARISAIYRSKPDSENVKRPLQLLRLGHTSIFRHVSCRFFFRTSLVVRDHLVRYTTSQMAAAGLRANEAQVFVPPADSPDLATLGEAHMADYHRVIHDAASIIDEEAQNKRLQDARYVAPCGVQVEWVQTFNLLTLIEAVFPQRLWEPGAQAETRQVVQEMYRQVHAQDPELWDLVYDLYGTEAVQWKKVRDRLRKQNPDLYRELLQTHGGLKSMWD